MTKRFVLPGLALAATLTLTACSAGPTDDQHAGGHPTGAASSSAPDDAERDGEPFNAADRAFARGMVPHHEQAVVMSDVVLADDGIDPQVRELAQAIKVAQQPEIDRLTTWLDEWGADPAGPDGGHGGHDGMDGEGMSGMMSEEDLADLEAADGAAAGSLFLTQMIEHHVGAVDMARTELDDGRHPGALAMAGEIVEVQQAEIDRMRELLERQ
ncbi:DUF305 domain-containing protein [Isoptericola cucumis]|uniref:DUF305 domain-containing protein n=1 Tax=Isoptericola cucumis TaxID=1776856 RepID=A0ABQ2B324_9MICO|nr:DUF305 domain-containing protein [Isoptericola cucumis]GGI06597.1 DUF305 domain-containing protein [Isoptericola cucumis]